MSAIPNSARRTIAVPRERNPFELWLMAATLLYGLVCSVAYDLAATSIRMYPGLGGRLFLVLLVVGSAVTLTGLAMRTANGLRVELAGLTILVGLCLAYIVWAGFSVGLRGVGLVLFMGVAIAGPGIQRGIQLRRKLGDIDREMV